VQTDDRNPFGLLRIGAHTNPAEFAFSLGSIAELSEPERRFTLSSADMAQINPNTKTAPIFRARADAELNAKIYARMPVLIDEAKAANGNLWGLSFMAMFHMSNDSGWFRTAVELDTAGFIRDGGNWIGEARYVPLYGAKMVHQFDHRWATYDGVDSRDAGPAEKQDPDFEPVPRYRVPESEVRHRLAAKSWTNGWLMGWRDICRPGDERTLISGVIPLGGCGDKFLLMLPATSPQLTAAPVRLPQFVSL
jgi:hypothetical protein